jgi:hypothetical protein
MPKTSSKYPTGGQNIDLGGSESVWSNPGNITANDGVSASANFAKPSISDYLRATPFGFSSLIPSTASILGFYCVVERRGDVASNFSDLLVRPRTSSWNGANKAKSSFYSTNWGTISYFWTGSEVPTSRIRDSSFGIDFQVQSEAGGNVYVDRIYAYAQFTNAYRWNGSSWVACNVWRFNGSAWAEIQHIQRWNGSAWEKT